MNSQTIGLALSGGGARAIAFHLGCLRALHDRGILERVNVISGVSGGSVIAALYAYNDESFEQFESHVRKVLSQGMVWGIARETLISVETPKIAAAIVLAGTAGAVAQCLQLMQSLLSLVKLQSTTLAKISDRILDAVPRFASRTTAFERYLARKYFKNRRMPDVQRKGLAVVLNATELRTGTAFRFGSLESGCWRFGKLAHAPCVATAVAASAAFPAFLPSLHSEFTFLKDGNETKHRVIITDGGVYDNLGASCMLPGRSSEFSTNAFSVDFVIACDAGQGIPSGARRPTFWASRMVATILTIHRRTQTLTQSLLHRMAANQEISGFVMPYLGQQDSALPAPPPDLVRREEVVDYPTNFNPMNQATIDTLSTRGEQLTRCLLAAYAPDL